MSVDPRETLKEYEAKERAKMLQSTEAISFTNESIIITDPGYIADKSDNDWMKCRFGKNMEVLGLKKFLVHSTISGDWSCTVYEQGTEKKLGEFCADAGLVGVFSLAEVLAYNPNFDCADIQKWGGATIIENFTGEVFIQVEKTGDRGITAADYEVSVIGKGSVNFYSRQTGL